ncbi:Por secretion system C-terminal sorting domain-containing protein [Lishizhenia tianjinensis]|uniref:Por secretion system C-terminal sorting domain-containing protein n=1 Tax=Lishizhenia tianjinensis TaxID=477690 RepID=A0A1I6ZRN8_9FLAO|nr:choice-of-anchor V domain-containing protein [Lishizhenia tianjinensis]SFT65235.1 Por secretion system C-terminal sorting domain-containing protein [Lishizhenia tianjinensis]
MKKIYNALAFGFALATLGVCLMSAYSTSAGFKYSAGPAHTGVDRTGGPLSGGNSCTQCHGSASSSTTTSITIREVATNNIVTQYVGGTQYKISVQVSHPTLTHFGFQMVATRMPFNQNAGTFGSFLTSNTQLSSLSARAYLEHDGASSSGSFEVFWTAPPANSGNVTFYYCANAVNNNGGSSGDAPGIASSLVFPELVPVTVTYASDYCTNASSTTPVKTGTSSGTFSANSSDITVNATTGAIDMANTLPGTYIITYTYSGGTIDNTVVINQSYEATVDTDICFGDSLFLDGDWQTTSGLYTDNYTAVNGCDSIINTNLTVLVQNVVDIDTTICQGDSVLVDGVYEKDPGTYTEVMAANNGCDSVINYNVSHEDYNTTLQVTASAITIQGTDATSFEFFDCDNGQVFSNSGNMVFQVPYIGNFAVRLFGPDCTYETNCEAFLSVGLEDENISAVRVYPNPVENQVQFSGLNKDEIVQIAVYTAEGKLMMNKSVTVVDGSFVLNLETLQKGVYFVQIQGEDYQFVKRLLKD